MAESMQGLKRTHRCAELSSANVGETVTIMGWVQKNRNKGGLVFVDVRDRSGIIQVVFEEGKSDAALIEKAAKLRSEFVVAIVGKVEKRSGAVNENLATGEIEVIPTELRILSESETPPFPIEENSKTKEELRLKYRYLDLRRPDLQKNLIMRSKVATLTRQFLAEEGFLEIETPFLIKSTPEGARDYLVPSRVHPGDFYALPQSPQIFKQLLMCSGYDRYFQIVKCFRDEDLRADRQPEFTQIDMELSFVDVDDVISVNERLLAKLFKEVLDIDVELPELVYDSNLIDDEGLYPLIDCIFSTGKYKSKSEVRRLIQQGAVKLNGEKTSEFSFVPEEGMVIQVGKGNVFKLKEQEKNKTLTKTL